MISSGPSSAGSASSVCLREHWFAAQGQQTLFPALYRGQKSQRCKSLRHSSRFLRLYRPFCNATGWQPGRAALVRCLGQRPGAEKEPFPPFRGRFTPGTAARQRAYPPGCGASVEGRRTLIGAACRVCQSAAPLGAPRGPRPLCRGPGCCNSSLQSTRPGALAPCADDWQT